MCLITKQSKAIKTDRDITAYKVIQLNGLFRSTPFMNALIEDSVILGEQAFKDKNMVHKSTYGKACRISKGVIHTYALAKSAIEMVEYLMRFFGGNYEIYECIIPKGTSYYSGYDESLKKGYGSKQIRFVKRLDINKEKSILGASQLKLNF